MKKPHIPGKVCAVVGAIALASLVAAPGAIAATAHESSPTPQASGMNAAFMEYLPAPTAPASVCVVDTGVDLTADTQPFVTSRLSVTADGLLDDMLLPYGHGTSVAAVMGSPRNGVGGVGLWPHVRVVSVRATSELYAGQANFTWNDYHRALELCLQVPEIKTVNFSLGGSVGGADYFLFMDEVLKANALGVSVVAAAGNTPGAPAYPAAAAGVVAVAANDARAGGSLCWFSASVPGILSAPGCNVEASSKPGDVFAWDGTSFAAPLVSALLTSLRAYRPDLSRQQVEDIVRQSGHLGADGVSVGVDAEAAFRAAGLGAMVDAAKAQAPGAGPAVDAPPSMDGATVVVRSAAPKVRWVRKVNGVVVIRLAPLGTGVRLKLSGSGRYRRVNATTIRATPAAGVWRLMLRAVAPDGTTSIAKVVSVASKKVTR